MDVAELVDMKLNGDGQPAADTAGDFIQTAGAYECILQEIALEAQTQEGDLWYDRAFGWSLLDFLHVDQDELAELQIMQRIRDKLSWYDEIDKKSIRVQLSWDDDIVKIQVLFRFAGRDRGDELALQLDRINAEVIVR